MSRFADFQLLQSSLLITIVMNKESTMCMSGWTFYSKVTKSDNRLHSRSLDCARGGGCVCAFGPAPCDDLPVQGHSLDPNAGGDPRADDAAGADHGVRRVAEAHRHPADRAAGSGQEAPQQAHGGGIPHAGIDPTFLTFVPYHLLHTRIFFPLCF